MRWRGSLVINTRDPVASAAEIRRAASDDRYIVGISIRRNDTISDAIKTLVYHPLDVGNNAVLQTLFDIFGITAVNPNYNDCLRRSIIFDTVNC